jgi:BASS family bile acid:Na+ symporter
MNAHLEAITRAAALVFLVSGMSAIGLGLTLARIIAPLRDPRLVAAALVANFIASPLLALGIARLLRLDEPSATGLLMLGLAAGAPFMPKVAGLAKLDPALPAGLMVLLMAASTVVLPLALPLLLPGTRVAPWEIARFLIALLLLPLAAGLLFQARRGSAAARLRPVLERISNVALLVLLALLVAANFQGLLRLFGSGALLAALLFALLCPLAGWRLGGRDPERRTALGLATGLRNIPAALVVAVQQFKDPGVPLMLVVTTLAGILVLIPAARRAGKRRSATANRQAPPPSEP